MICTLILIIQFSTLDSIKHSALLPLQERVDIHYIKRTIASKRYQSAAKERGIHNMSVVGHYEVDPFPCEPVEIK